MPNPPRHPGDKLAQGSLPCAGEPIGVHVTHARTRASPEYGERLTLHLVTQNVQLDFVDLTPNELSAWA